MKSSTPILHLCTAVFLSALVFAAAASADPLLTKAQIAKAAAKIDACLLKQDGKKHGKSANCVGIIKGPCDDAISAGGEAAHATCSDNETAAWDVLLNKFWGDMPAYLSPPRFAALKDVQKVWLSYRGGKCAFLNDLETMGPWGLMLAADCRLDETSRRTIELRDILRDPNFRAE